MAHIIWGPIMGADDLAAAQASKQMFAGLPVTQYWDADLSVGIALKDFAELPKDNDELAWDVYFIYEPGSEWGDHAPAPADYWHQFNTGNRYLADGVSLRTALEASAASSGG